MPDHDACDPRLKCEIVDHLQAWNEIELLEHETQPITPHRGAVAVGKLRHQRSIEPDFAAVGLSSPAIRCSSVLLPLPDSPVSATLSPQPA
jgi:hypothetical protein